MSVAPRPVIAMCNSHPVDSQCGSFGTSARYRACCANFAKTASLSTTSRYPSAAGVGSVATCDSSLASGARRKWMKPGLTEGVVSRSSGRVQLAQSRIELGNPAGDIGAARRGCDGLNSFERQPTRGVGFGPRHVTGGGDDRRQSRVRFTSPGVTCPHRRHRDGNANG
jgi:hypothetical protein